MRIGFITVGDTARLTGGYLYHREVFARLRAAGHSIDEIVASAADAEAQRAAAPGLGSRVDLRRYDVLVIDALARIVASPWADRWRAALPLVAMVHELPSVAAGLGALAAELALEEPLLRADRLIAVSDDGAAILAGRGAARERIIVAPGGYDRLAQSERAADMAPHPSPPTPLPQWERGATGRQWLSGSQKPPLPLRERGGAQRRGEGPDGIRTRSLKNPAHVRMGRSPLVALCVAQWIARKGILELVRAWGSAERPAARLELVGETQADPAYAATVHAAIGAAPGASIVVRGPLSDAALAAAYASADLFALPTFYEGYGIAFAEALAHGLPVLGCAVGPLPALIGPEAGLLVPPGDGPALAVALDLLLADGALRAKMGTAARERARSLPTWAGCAERFLDALAAASGR